MGAHGELCIWTYPGKVYLSHPNETLYFHIGLRHLIFYFFLSLSFCSIFFPPLFLFFPPTHSSVLEAIDEEIITHFFRITNEPPLCLWTAGLSSLWTKCVCGREGKIKERTQLICSYHWYRTLWASYLLLTTQFKKNYSDKITSPFSHALITTFTS